LNFGASSSVIAWTDGPLESLLYPAIGETYLVEQAIRFDKGGEQALSFYLAIPEQKPQSFLFLAGESSR
jgi:hypothetical protein